MNFIVIFLVGIFLLLYPIISQRTPFNFSLEERNFSGGIFFVNTCLFILPCIISIQHIDLAGSPVLFFVSESSLIYANISILYGLFCFLVFIRVFFEIFTRQNITLKDQLRDTIHAHRGRVQILFYYLCLLVAFAVLFSIVGLGARHAFFAAVLSDTSAGIIRHENAAIQNLSYLKHFIYLNCALLALTMATPIFDNKPILKIFGTLTILIGGTFYGAKSLLIIFSLVYLFSYIESHERTSARSLIIKASIFAAASILILYIAVYITYIRSNDQFDFFTYAFNRIVIGQMAGMYEQWNLWIRNGDYLYHSIPFASFFVDYPIFHKDLMLVSEGRIDPNSIGIKNTFFLAEAYAVFGTPGVILMPIILAFAFVLNFLIIKTFFSKLVFKNDVLGNFFASYIFVVFFGLTDGISQAMFLKGGVVVLILFAPLVPIFGMFERRSSGRRTIPAQRYKATGIGPR